MGELKPKNEEPKKNRRFSQEQYEFLKKCSEKGEESIKEWNEWRKANPDVDIELEGRDFSRWSLGGAHLNAGKGRYPHPNTGTIIPDNSKILPYELQGKVYLQGAKFIDAHLEWADFRGAYLKGADFNKAHLEHAFFQGAHLTSGNFFRGHLEGAHFGVAIVDGSTLIWGCQVNKYCKDGSYTDFSGVALDAVRIDPGTKQLLEYNVMRMNWEEWYKEHWFWRWPVRLFWAMSDYGRSTGRVVLTFFILAAIFAVVYWLWPNLVMVNKVVGDIRGFWHGLYFSVVTMTTLGFGDIAANPDSWWGQTLLMVQVILGYVLLGALVTRFAVLFTAGGPAGKFADEKKEKKATEDTEKKIRN